MTSETIEPANTSHEAMLAVMNYRLDAVDKNIVTLLERFDGVAQFYVTNATLMLTLNPIKERIDELDNAQKERDKQKHSEQSQFRLALAMAILAPVFTIIINMIFLQMMKGSIS